MRAHASESADESPYVSSAPGIADHSDSDPPEENGPKPAMSAKTGVLGRPSDTLVCKSSSVHDVDVAVCISPATFVCVNMVCG